MSKEPASLLAPPSRWVAIPPPVLLAAIGVLYVMDLRGSYDPQWLLLICNFLFSTLTAAAIVALVIRAFVQQPGRGLGLLNAGVVFFGLAGVMATALGGEDANSMLTIHNVGVWCSALCHVLGVVLADPHRRLRWPGVWLAVGLAGPFLVLLALAHAARAGWTPLFFLQGAGGTAVRTVVLASAAGMFALSALLLRTRRHARQLAFQDWYAPGLLLIAAGLLGLTLQREHGSVLGWASRATMWTAGIYLLIAAWAAEREAATRPVMLAPVHPEPRLCYALAAVFVVAALVLRLVFLPMIGSAGMTVTFFPAVIFSALYGGRGPALFAAVLSALAINFFWMEPVGKFSAGTMADRIILALFLAGSGLIAFVAEVLQKARAEAAESEALRAARDDAQAANAAKDRFLAQLSHELRTPLTPALMLAQDLLAHGNLDSDARADVTVIARNIELEARLIDDLLDVTRIARGKLTVRPESCDLHDLLELAVGMVRPEAQEKGVEVEIERGARDTAVTGDPARLQQVFWNLLRNAVKFTPSGGRVAVRAYEIPGDENGAKRLAVEVHDTGIGFDPESAKRIFEPFEQEVVDGRPHGGGLGLGLAIARGIVELHHGTIRAESRGRGKGAVFVVELPGRN